MANRTGETGPAEEGPGRNRPFGVLGAGPIRKRQFTQNDMHPFQAVASVLAAALERKVAG